MAIKFYLFLISFLTLAVTATAVDIPTIHCPTEQPHVRRLQLQEQWRIDDENPEAPLLGYFGQSQVFVHDGRVYMLDSQLCQVLVFSDEGEYLDTIMREGDGPGEVRNPGVMFLRSDGRIAVQHGYPTKMEFVDLDGTPRGRWRLQDNAWMNRIMETPQGWYGVYTASQQSDDLGVFVSIFHAALLDDEGNRTAEFYSEENRSQHKQGAEIIEADEHNPWYTAVAVGNNEIVLAAARDEYRLEWRNLSGETTRIVTREYTAHRRTQAELDKLKYSNYTMVNDDLQFPNRRLSEHDSMIRTIEPMPDGSLRVRTSLFEKDMPQGMVCRYEVHEPTGELRERVEIYDPTGEYDVKYDAIALLDDDRVMVLRNQRPAFRAATDAGRHPKIRKMLPPVPDDREDIAFTPIMCEVVSYSVSGDE